MNYLKVPDSNIKLTDGSIVMLARFPGTKWVVHYGWYDYSGRRGMGWYFCSIPAQTVLPVSAQDLQLITLVDPSGDSCLPNPPCPPGPPCPPYFPPGPFPFPPGPGPSGDCGPGPFIPPLDGSICDESYPPDSSCFPGPISPIGPCPIDPGPGEDSGLTPGNPFVPFTRNDKFMVDCSFVSLPSINYRDCLNTICKIPDGKIVRINNVDGKVRYYCWNDSNQIWNEIFIEVDPDQLLEDYYNKDEVDQQLQTLSNNLHGEISDVSESVDGLVTQLNTFKDEVDGEFSTVNSSISDIQSTIDDISTRLEALESAVFRIEKIVADATNTVLVSQNGTLKDSGVSIGDDTIEEPSEYAQDKVLATEKAVAKKVEQSVTKWSSF